MKFNLKRVGAAVAAGMALAATLASTGAAAVMPVGVTSSNRIARIDTINIGAATSLGVFNGTRSGLTVSAVPEPETYALLLAGLMGIGLASRRRVQP